MTQYSTGQRISYRQVRHSVPLESSNSAIPVHDDPKSGLGMICAAMRVRQEWRLVVLPDSERAKKEQITLLLRIPPDEAIIL
jgi:hypothetical protein